MKRRSLQNYAGYTIIEMMIVVVIIGILASIAIPNYSGVLSKARKSACLANQRAIEMARMYKSIEGGDFGSSLVDLESAFTEMGFVGKYGAEDLECPSDGVYVFISGTFEITCSILDHNN